jgi:hypothetical protein
MGTEYAFVTYDRSEFNLDLLSFKGMAREAKVRMIEADAKKKAKEEAKAAKAAAEAAAKGDEPAPEPGAPESDEPGPEKDGDA